MKKKKCKKFKELDINIENKPKKSLKITATIKISSGNKIITLQNISYFIIEQKNLEQKTFSFTIFNKDNFELIQHINSDIYYQCFALNENYILLSKTDSSTELWIKDKSNKFIKNKILEICINSNIIFNSKCHLFFYYLYPDSHKSEIQIWETKDNIPQNMIKKFPTVFSSKKKLFFIKNETILVVYHCPLVDDIYTVHSNNISISFYEIENFQNIKNIILENEYCDLKPFKLDEDRILIFEKISADCSYDDNIKQNIQIMKIPEFEIVKEIEPFFDCNDVLIYKNYFILYKSIIRIYKIENYQLFKEINIRGIYSLIQLKDNFLIGIVNQNAALENYDYYDKEKNQIRDIIIYKANF